jgi:tetratricopeptide (TPR) repeat protein
MAQILKFPASASRLGYKRVKQRAKAVENPDQLSLFPRPTAQVLTFAPASSRFEAALRSDERGDPQAGALYEEAIAAQDCVADAYCNLGIIESQKGDTTKAFDCFTTCLKHNPRHSEAHYNLGNLYFELNDFRLAQVHYEMAAEIDPLFANIYFNLALVHAIRNDFQPAINALVRYQELAPPDASTHAEELLQNLRKSLATAKTPRLGEI